jgi:hypothetical protein
MASVTAIADGLVEQLSELEFGEGVDPVVVRAYFPNRDRDQLAALTLTVMPRGMEVELIGRHNVLQKDVTIDIGVQRQIEAGDEAAIAAGVSVVEAIAAALPGTAPDGVSDATCIGVEIDPMVSQEHATNLRVFTGIVTARYRMHQ